MKELKATRVPPGDRWTVVGDDQLYSSLTEALNAVFIDTGLSQFYIDAQKGEVDKNKRKAVVHEFEKTALENAWVLPITYTDRVIALNSKVKGYVIANSHILNNTWRGVYLDN